VRVRAALVASICLLGMSAPAGAEVYRWTDATGRIHFTEDLSQIPQAHRAAAERQAAAPKSDRLQTYSSNEARPPGRRAGSGGSGRSIQVPFTHQGTLMVVDVRLNDSVTAPFYVDTGASGISIPLTLASRLGLGIGPDTKRVLVRTANGVVSEPVVVLDAIELAGARVERLEAVVSSSMPIGLLGGSFFNNFVYQVDAAEKTITLTPNPNVHAGGNEAEWRQRFRGVRDALVRVEAKLERTPSTHQQKIQELTASKRELEAALRELEAEADQEDVPHAWRE
jgi:clan AA aspartic protease (TIGR02281 family)